MSDYADWVSREISHQPPGDIVRSWAQKWESLFRTLQGADAPIELAGLVIARWEFLGALSLGNTENTGVRDAIYYLDNWLMKANSKYVSAKKLVTNMDPAPRLDIFSMLRNSPFHGVVPAGIATSDSTGVVTWWVGTHGIKATDHLSVDEHGGLHVDVKLLCAELISSMTIYATYLDEDTDASDDSRKPKCRMKRALWARYAPKFMEGSAWMTEGTNRHIPA